MQKPLIELHFLPSVSYFALLAAHPIVRLEACENFQKGSFRNRCSVATSQGLLDLSLPLRGGKNQQCPIRAVELSFEENWLRQHWRTIESVYRSAPFWLFYADHFAPLFLENEETRLWDFNLKFLEKCMQLVGCQTVIEFSTAFETEPSSDFLDFRNQISPKKKEPLAPFQPTKYAQLFEDRLGFQPDLSILDLLFCEGKQSLAVLRKSWTCG